VLEAEFPAVVEAEPQLLARHLTEARLGDRAAAKWEEAGRRALAHSALREAAVQLREAVRLIRELPESRERDTRELSLLLTLGQALFGSLGGAAPETVATFSRAKAIALSAVDRDAFCRSVYGMFVGHTIAGRLDLDLSLGAEAMAFAEKDGSAIAVVVASRILGMACLMRGELLEAERHLRLGVEVSRRERARGAAAWGYAHDPIGTAPASAAPLAWALGRPEEAAALVQEGLEAVMSAQDTNSVCFAFVLCALVALCSR
jgi:hypothetical protein